jgi:hypothetical protein
MTLLNVRKKECNREDIGAWTKEQKQPMKESFHNVL